MRIEKTGDGVIKISEHWMSDYPHKNISGTVSVLVKEGRVAITTKALTPEGVEALNVCLILALQMMKTGLTVQPEAIEVEACK